MPIDYHTLPADELLTILQDVGRTPAIELIRACLARREELTPGLLQMLSYKDEANWVDDDPRWYGRIHAGHLLIAYREPAALPVFADLFRDEEDEDILLEWFGVEIAAYGPRAIETALTLLKDRTAPEWTPVTMTETLTVIALQHPEEWSRIVAELQAQLPLVGPDGHLVLPAKRQADDDALWGWILYALATLRDTTSVPLGKALYEAELIDETIMGDVDDYLALVQSGEASYKTAHSFDIIETYEGFEAQAIQEEEWKAKAAELIALQPPPVPLPMPQPTSFAPYEKQQPYVRPTAKIGRNDPCPCGSGKKYKKCHGANA